MNCYTKINTLQLRRKQNRKAKKRNDLTFLNNKKIIFLTSLIFSSTHENPVLRKLNGRAVRKWNGTDERHEETAESTSSKKKKFLH
jgi:hypothetical protein